MLLFLARRSQRRSSLLRLYLESQTPCSSKLYRTSRTSSLSLLKVTLSLCAFLFLSVYLSDFSRFFFSFSDTHSHPLRLFSSPLPSAVLFAIAVFPLVLYVVLSSWKGGKTYREREEIIPHSLSFSDDVTREATAFAKWKRPSRRPISHAESLSGEFPERVRGRKQERERAKSRFAVIHSLSLSLSKNR